MHRFNFFVASHAETTRNNSFQVGRDVLATSCITSKWRLPAIALCASISIAFPVSAQDARTDANDFLVGDIRVEGLQRIAEGTVFNYLPINIGDRLDRKRIQEALRALYATKLFEDIEMRRDGRAGDRRNPRCQQILERALWIDWSKVAHDVLCAQVRSKSEK